MNFMDLAAAGSPWSRANQRYDEYFRCYSSAMLAGPSRDNVNYGGKVIMPPSALDKLTRLNIAYPMQFELRNNRKGAVSHAGVLEFIAEEGRVYLPHWMMKTLKLEEGDLLQVLTTDLPQGTFVQLEPQSPDFLKISDPKAVLEHTMRNFSTLTKGDIFQFSYNDHVYEVAVLQVKPESTNMAISVIETDLSVDFATPKGYVEPERTRTPAGRSMTPQNGGMSKKIGYEQLKQSTLNSSARFSGGGERMSGKKSSIPDTPVVRKPERASGGQANPPAALRLPRGTLFFGYELRLPKDKEDENAKEGKKGVKHFAGRGQTIRQSTKKEKQPDVIEID